MRDAIEGAIMVARVLSSKVNRRTPNLRQTNQKTIVTSIALELSGRALSGSIKWAAAS
jgi:hypothetical protein